MTPYIVGWSALSPLGVGRQEFADGVVSGRTGQRAEPADARGGPAVGYPMPCDPRQLVGTKGTRALDRMTLLVIATVGIVLDEHSAELGDDAGAVGLVLGTSTGSIASITEFTRDTFVRDRPYLVDPAAFPNTVVNGPAGRTAVWYGLRGLNSTVSAGQITGLAALRYASRMIRRGYADTLLVGAVEEYSTPVARAIGERSGAPIGEGCVVFLVSSARAAAEHGRTPVAELVDFQFAMADVDGGPAAQGKLLATGIRTLLSRHDLDRTDLWLISMAQCGGDRLDAAERAAVDAALDGGNAPRRVVVAGHVGNTFSALGAFQLAVVLAMCTPLTAEPLSRTALITSLGPDGAVACALVRT